VFSWLVVVALAADANAPHPHKGVMERYPAAPAMPTLTAAEIATLAAGDAVRKQVQTNSGEGAAGGGVAIQDIHADTETVWKRILDFGSYPKMVENVKTCEVYSKSGDQIGVHFVIGVPLVSIEYWIDHQYHPEEGWMTWTLDYTKHSDFDDTRGFWRVAPHPDKEGWSRVVYSADVKASGWVPGPIENAFATAGLKKATGWVKREAEAAAGH
jgi:carbon monoxide dehydrogenase subunit G